MKDLRKPVKIQDSDTESEVVVEGKNRKEPVVIQDNLGQQQEHREGYVSVPNKLPLNIFIACMVQFIVLVAAGTNIYTSTKSDLAVMNEKLVRLESNMYTNNEARLRLELEDSKIEQLKRDIDSISKK